VVGANNTGFIQNHLKNHAVQKNAGNASGQRQFVPRKTTLFFQAIKKYFPFYALCYIHMKLQRPH